MYSLFFSNKAIKFLKKCDESLKKRISEKIETLSLDPVPHNSVKVVGEERSFRLRIGDYRVLYTIDWKKQEILIVKIGQRPSVYD